MPYVDNHSNHLNDIITLLKANKIFGQNEAFEKFEAYLTTIQSIGNFDSTEWKIEWRKKIYYFGEEFKNISPNKFLKVLDEKLQLHATNKEVL